MIKKIHRIHRLIKVSKILVIAIPVGIFTVPVLLFFYAHPYIFINPKVPSPSGLMPVSDSIYQKDKKIVAETVVKNVEYYRLYYANGRECSEEEKEVLRTNHPLAQEDVWKIYSKRYAMRSHMNHFLVVSPLPTSTQLKVTTDTIIYNKTGLMFMAIVVVEKKYSHIDSLDDRYDYKFDSMGFVGVRNALSDSLKIYPHDYWTRVSENYRGAVDHLLILYMLRTKDRLPFIGKFRKEMDVRYFKHNLGEDGFFEESNLFQKYDSTRYNYQVNHGNAQRYMY